MSIFLVLLISSIFIFSQFPASFASENSVNVIVASGSSVPGCETVDAGQCYMPSRITIDTNTIVN